jgi:hypothetical protein
VPNLRADVRTTRPATLQSAIDLAAESTEELLRSKGSRVYDAGQKTTWDGTGGKSGRGSDSKKGRFKP